MISPRRKQCAIAVAATASLALVGCDFIAGGDSDGDAEAGDAECSDVSLRLATIRAEEDPTTMGAQAFADGVAEETDGQVEIDIYPNSQLGDDTEIYAGLAAGQDVDIFYEGISTYETLEGAEAFTVLSVPFLWDSYEQFRDVLHTDRYQELIEEAAEDTGVRVVAAAGDAEPRALSANRAIQSADDMAGVDLRIADAPMPQEFAQALGANPQVVALSDLYFSLNQGMVDAQENGAITMVNQSLMEVQSHYMPTDYIRDLRVWYFNDDQWSSLCAEHQQVIQEQAEVGGDVATEETESQMEESIEAIDEEMELVDVDVESFRSELEGVFEQFDGEMWPEGLLEETRDLADEHR